MLFNKIDLYAQKTHIIQLFFYGSFGTAPQSIAFNVDSYIVNLGMPARQPNGVIAFAAGQFKYNGVVIAKNLMPASYCIVVKVECIIKFVEFVEFYLFGFAHSAKKVQKPCISFEICA